MSSSPAQIFATLSREMQREVLASMSASDLTALEHSWQFWARPDQIPPVGDWRTWLILAGRGWGKTKTLSEWIRDQAESGRRRQIGLVGPTADAIRRTQVEGPSGILAVSPPDFRPTYEPSSRRILWPNGCVAHLFSAEEPDRLRGPNLDAAGCDELSSWQNLEATWDMLQMALRLPGPTGAPPQVTIATTPRPVRTLKAIMAAPSTVITRGRTMDNAANLDGATLRYLEDKYGGTTLGRQELDAEMLSESEGALWSRAMLEDGRVVRPPELRRIVVAIDPAGGSGRKSDETGIVCAGIGSDGHAYVLADASGRFSPEGWARKAVDLFKQYQADRIVAEQNFGGAMVEAVLRSVQRSAPIRMVHASRGKAVRAEPVVALYEQRRVHHVGNFPVLEDQLCQWAPNSGDASPDRLDALVWAVTDLTLGVQRSFSIQKLGY